MEGRGQAEDRGSCARRSRFRGRVRYLDDQSAASEVTSFDPPWTDDDTAALADVAPQIRRLALPRSNLTARSAAVFNQMTSLERLDLRSAAVGDTFVDALEPPRLRELNLFGTGVTDAAVPALARLAGLRSLYLGSTPMTAEAVQQLRVALPACEILHAAASSPADNSPDPDAEDHADPPEDSDAGPGDEPEALSDANPG